MSTRKYCRTERLTRFFLINLSHETLENYFKTNFLMMQHFNYSLSDLEGMLPWEREVYLMLLNDHLEERAREEQRQAR
jgi:hypothetical protein